MQKIKSLLEKKWAFVGLSLIITMLIYSLIVVCFKPTFANWLNGITDVVIGFYLCILVVSSIEIAKKGKKFFTWQYGVFIFVSLLALFCFYSASRVDNIATMFINLACFGVNSLVSIFVYKIIYYPSTKTFEELQQDAWDKMKERLPKIGREKFLDWEKGFRVCKTTDGTINGDLDFDNYFFTIDLEGKAIPMTFKSAQARGYMDVAQTIHDTLVKELNEAEIK